MAETAGGNGQNGELVGMEVTGEDDHSVFVRAGAGIRWDDFVSQCVLFGWGGVENLSLIPGSVGAAPVQNIGAYGQEVATSIHTVFGFDFLLNDFRIIPGDDCQFGYRDSIFKKELKNRFLILWIIFKLAKHPDFNLSYDKLNEIAGRSGPFHYRLSGKRD